ncbi:MAG: hypothetical protein H6Q90_3753 [Deltaproteobacteria bacterium]|nr:hypothetical protein [Deltaproteobacteria bacterium]
MSTIRMFSVLSGAVVAASCGVPNGADLCGTGTVFDGAHCVPAPDAGLDANPDEPTACVGTKRPGPCSEAWSHAKGADPTSLVDHSYDSHGRLSTSTTKALDDHGAWYVTLIESRTYDAAGHLTRNDQRRGGGTVSYYEAYTYDGDRLTRKETGRRVADGSGPGAFSLGITISHYDGAGRLTSDDFDQDDDGTHSTVTYRYDGDRLVERDHDSPRNGTIDAKELLGWDAAGRLATEDTDSNLNGTIDARTTHHYDLRGNLVEDEIDYGDVAHGAEGPDGIIEARLSWTYDAACNLTHTESDAGGTGADGIPDALTDFSFTCW